jgi:virulence-associated protein VapD
VGLRGRFSGGAGGFGFDRVQGSVYLTERDDLANLFNVIMASKALAWLPDPVREIRAFKVEHGADFMGIVKD